MHWSEAKKIAFIFPGQGSQAVGMGKDFYDTYEEAREVYDAASEILGVDIAKIMFEGPEEELTRTVNTQTAIYLHCMAILHVLDNYVPELKPDITAGHSLGEYTALSAADRLAFDDGIQLVRFRGQFMQEACDEQKGTMAAILGLSAEQIEQVVAEVNRPNDLWAANFNCPGQVVISGTEEGVTLGMEAAKAKGAKRAIPLKVSGGFHSGLMKSAERKLAEKVAEVELDNSDVPVVMNVSAQFENESDRIKELMIQQVTSSVRWEQSVRAMDEAGVDLFIEIGAPKTLAGMNRKIGVQAPTLVLNSVEDMKQFETEMETKDVE